MKESRYLVYMKYGLEDKVIAKFGRLKDAKAYAKKELEEERRYLVFAHQVSIYYIKDCVTGKISRIK